MRHSVEKICFIPWGEMYVFKAKTIFLLHAKVLNLNALGGGVNVER